MELRHSIRNIESNIKDSNSFTIKTSSKAFKILSDNLYADKITAVIRELSTNAYDSHVEANKLNIPFEVHLPSYDELWFSVKDFGTGMPHDQIINLYTSYFDSDKTNSNELVGALGLGSKSPFAYTDTFSVESIYNDVKNSYACFISEEGIPNITLLNSEKTQSSNGVEVKFAVKRDDINEFIKKARKVYSYFNIKPSIVSYPDYEFEKENILFSGEGWKLVESSGFSDRCAKALQGNIAYPINNNRLNNISEKIEFICENEFIIDFKLGLLDISASREDLSYDKITIQNIISKLENVYDEFKNFIQDEISNQKSFWNAVSKYKEITKNIKRENILYITYDNKKLSENISIDLKDYKCVINKYYIHYSNNIIKDTYPSKSRFFSITPGSKNVVFFYDDLGGRKASSRIRYFVENNSSTSAFLISGDDSKKIFDILGNPDFINASKLPKRQRKVETINKKSWRSISSVGIKNYNKVYSIDNLPEEMKFYAESNRNTLLHNDKSYDSAIAYKYMINLLKLNVIKEEVIILAIPRRDINSKEFNSIKNLYNIFDFYNKKISNLIKRHKRSIIEYLNHEESKNKLNISRSLISVFQNENVMNELSNDSQIKKLFNMYNEIQEKSFDSKIITLAKIAKNLNKDVIKNVNSIAINNPYPLLEMISQYDIKYCKPEQKEYIIDYINLVDKRNK